MKLNTTCAAIALTIGLGAAANAALIHGNGNVTLVNGAIDTGAGSSPISGASDGNITDTTNGQVFTDDPGGFPSDYFVSVPGGLVFDIDLGSAMSLDGVSFWNRGGVNANGTTALNVVFSTDAIFGNGDDSSSFAFNPGNIGGAQQDFALGTTVSNAQFVRVSITDNDFGVGLGGDRVALTEVQFNAVPEPSSTALLGLGGLALLLRRRK